jgi:ABC-2 type transport system ATP-binding protein
MDEAERCHRLAILDHGALVADGTPKSLTGELQGRTLVVAAANPRQVQRVLLDEPGVLSVAQVGNALRVLMDEGDAAAEPQSRLAQALRQAGLDAEVDAVEPNLEDVFVAVTRDDDRGAAA